MCVHTLTAGRDKVNRAKIKVFCKTRKPERCSAGLEGICSYQQKMTVKIRLPPSVMVRTSRPSQHLKHKQNAKHPTRPFQRLVIRFILGPVGMPYLYEMDEGSENGTAEHVVFFWLLPKKRKVLNQAAHVRTNLDERREKVKHWFQSQRSAQATTKICLFWVWML